MSKPESELTLVWAEILTRFDVPGNPECILIEYEDEDGGDYWGLEVVDNLTFMVVTKNGGLGQIIFRRDYEDYLENG